MAREGNHFDVYISYAREDRKRVAELVAALEEGGINVAWDQAIPAGVSFSKAVQDFIRNTKAVIVCWSHASAKSPVVQQEANRAILTSNLVQLQFDADVQLSLPFRAFTWINWRTSSEPEVQPLARLLQALARLGISPGFREEIANYSVRPAPKNRGYAFVSHTEDDLSFVPRITKFLRRRQYGYWSYYSSVRDYQKPTALEIEERMGNGEFLLSIVTPAWKASEWTQRELAHAREIRKPMFHLRFIDPGPTLAIAGETYFDCERDEKYALKRLGQALDLNNL
jgi:hypothetical protein